MSYYNITKRSIDIFGSLFGLIIFSPIFIVVTILVKLTSKGPIFFTQERVGKDRKIFNMFKFRTMYMYEMDGKVVHAAKQLDIDPKLKEAYQNNSYKLKNDPRITPVGNILRKTSLDELPQFLNVLFGDMSLVGPRAFQEMELEHQLTIYPQVKKLTEISLKVRPGASGPWQISGRSDINFDKRVEIDAEYAQRHSIFYDLSIIIRTPIVMLIGKGAV